jgi:beta-phosphoglucomutase-like phosphatase (HAD superfamily)
MILGDDPELGAGKPAPDPFLLAARRLGVAAQHCWAFEDSPAGARSAADAGCRVHVVLPPELSAEEVARLYEPDWVILRSLEELELGEAAEAGQGAQGAPERISTDG